MEENKTKIKICGITREAEAVWLNEAGADFAGFVFYPPSKRYVSIEKATSIATHLNPGIRRVAVTVSPDETLVEQIMAAGFDVIQIHKRLEPAVLEKISIPVWYAFNVSRPEEVKKQEEFFTSLPPTQAEKIEGIVVDGAEFGSGNTFDWESTEHRWRNSPVFENRKFILAGGLTQRNVADGIQIFSPDIVDVSSGVEIKSEDGFRGKDPAKIREFCRQVKEV